MANKKSTGKKNTNSKKKDIQKENKINSQKIENIGGFDGDFNRVVLVVGIIVIVFCLFYFLTVFLTKQDKQNIVESDETNISYTEVLAGRSFSLPEEEYLVLYYDFDDEEISSDLSSDVLTYKSGTDALTIYTSNMGSAFNQSYVSEESNISPKDAASLAINGPTLIHFKEGSVVEYLEGFDSIHEYLG